MTVTVAEAKMTLRRRAVQRRQHLQELVREAEQDVAAIIRMLVARYRPKRIYQWGSLVDATNFREWSDIDLALEGLEDPLDGLRAADDASRMTRFPWTSSSWNVSTSDTPGTSARTES